MAEIRESLRFLPPEALVYSVKNWSMDACKTPQPPKVQFVNSPGALLACTLISSQRLPDLEQGTTRILHRTATAAEVGHVCNGNTCELPAVHGQLSASCFLLFEQASNRC